MTITRWASQLSVMLGVRPVLDVVHRAETQASAHIVASLHRLLGLVAALLLLLAKPANAQEVTTTLQNEADGTRTLAHEIIVPASIADTWQAIATPKGWQSWAVPLAREVTGSGDRFETGYDLDAAPGAASTIEQQWIARKAPRQATFRTTRTPAGFPHGDAYRRVVSTFHLSPEGGSSTRVRLTGSGYPAGPAGDALIAFFRKGNRTSLLQLYQRFVDGPINWSARPGVPERRQ